MKKQSIFIRAGTIILSVLMFLGILLVPKESVFAAEVTDDNSKRDYTDAREFYNSFKEGSTRTIFYNGYIWYTTKSGKAASYTTRRYKTLGYKIVLTSIDGTKSVSFNCKRGGQYTIQPAGSEVDDGKYYYNMYYISYNDIMDLAMYTNESVAKEIFSQDKLHVAIYPVVTERNVSFNDDGTVKQDNTHGSVTETEVANALSDGRSVYITTFSHTCCEKSRVWDFSVTSELNTAKSRFPGAASTFEAYANMNSEVYNYKLTIYYKANGGTTNSFNIKSDTGTLLNSADAEDYFITSAYRWQTMSLLSNGNALISPGVTSPGFVHPDYFGLTKKGYHIDNTQAWIVDSTNGGNVNYSSINYINTNNACYPSQLNSQVEFGSTSVILKANWQPNTYTIEFDGNGGAPMGTGNVDIVATYDDASQEFPTCMYQKDGYKFIGWKIASVRDELFQPGDNVDNLTSIDRSTLTAVAQWESLEHPIVVDNHGGTGGADIFYEVYNKGFFLYSQKVNSSQNSITKVAIPTLTGKEFIGYFTSASGGKMVVNASGNIVQPNTYFTQSVTIHAQYKPVQPTLNFDMQGGEYGTTSTKLTYGSTLPSGLGKPQKSGYTFAGYFSDEDGQGTMYYTENMAPCITCTWTEERTVYAYWVDKNAPTVTLKSNYLDWTNKDIILTMTANEGTLASDTGIAGLQSVVLYRNGEEVFSNTTLNGAKTYSDTFAHPTDNSGEGVYIYTLEVIDRSGNKATTMVTVKYDITPPTVVKVERFEVTDTGVDIYVQVNDNNVAAQALATVELLSLYMENESSEETTSPEDELPTDMTQPLEVAACTEEQTSSKTTQTMESAEVQEGTMESLTFDEGQIIEDVPSVSMKLLTASINANAPPGVSI